MNLIFIDSEISGFRAYDQLVEFSAIDINHTIMFNSIISGAESIESSLSKIHGISHIELFNGLTPVHLQEFIDTHANDYIFCSYGLQFDLNWISHTINLYDNKKYTFNGICLMEVINSITNKKLSLDLCMNLFGIPYPQAHLDFKRHRAHYDAYLHRNLYSKINDDLGHNLENHIKKFTPQSI